MQELENVASKQFLTVTEPGGEPRLAATTALTNWNSANLTVIVTNQNGAMIFPAPDASSGAQRFYRAVWQ